MFLDKGSLPPGLPNGPGIRAAAAECDDLVAVVGPVWADEENIERLADEWDWVRWEITQALARAITVVPVVLLLDAAIPKYDELPTACGSSPTPKPARCRCAASPRPSGTWPN